MEGKIKWMSGVVAVRTAGQRSSECRREEGGVVE